MATTTLNTRIQLKYDTYENWTTNNPVLLAGEVAVTTVQSAQAPVSQVPAILFKVGDGTNKFNTLKWASAIAADVYPWAKASVKPTYQASEIEGLEDYISGQIEDTDTQYQIIASGTNGIQLQSRPKTGGEWSNVGSPITITYTLATGTTNGTVSFNGTEVAVKGLGSAAYTESSAYDAAGTAAGVQTAVIGTSGDQSSAITIYGTRKYAEEQATAAQTAATTAANSYTDGQITQAKTDLIGTGDATSTTIKGAVTESKTYADTQIAAKIGSVYKPAGSVAFEDLPTPAVSLLGNVYNVTNAFTADAEFITGEQGTQYPAGTNVVVVEVEDAYYYDALTGIVDLSSYATQTWVNGQLQTQSENLIGEESGVTANTIQGAVVEARSYADGVGVPSTEGVPTDYLLSPAGWVAPPRGGGGSTWRQIIDITVDEDTSSFLVSQDAEGNPISLQEFYVLLDSEIATSNPATTCNVEINGIFQVNNAQMTNTEKKRYYYMYAKLIPNAALLFWHEWRDVPYNTGASLWQYLLSFREKPAEITSLRVTSSIPDKVIAGPGSRLRIWGVNL